MHRLARLGAQSLEQRSGDGTYVEPPHGFQADGDQRVTRLVPLRGRVLTDEAVVGQHGQQAVGGRVGDAERRRGVGEPDLASVAEHQQEARSAFVDRRDRILGLRRAGVHAFV